LAPANVIVWISIVLTAAIIVVGFLLLGGPEVFPIEEDDLRG
jgi:hypothetical protein